MKNINYLNYFFVGVPAILFSIDFIDPQHSPSVFYAIGLLFSILTGLFQITIGGSMLMDEPKDKSLQLYIYGVILYFILICINPYLPKHDFKIYFFVALPVLLAIHLTIIIYKKAHQ